MGKFDPQTYWLRQFRQGAANIPNTIWPISKWILDVSLKRSSGEEKLVLPRAHLKKMGTKYRRGFALFFEVATIIRGGMCALEIVTEPDGSGREEVFWSMNFGIWNRYLAGTKSDCDVAGKEDQRRPNIYRCEYREKPDFRKWSWAWCLFKYAEGGGSDMKVMRGKRKQRNRKQVTMGWNEKRKMISRKATGRRRKQRRKIICWIPVPTLPVHKNT